MAENGDPCDHDGYAGGAAMRRRQQSGVVLIVVLWVVALLSVLLMGFVAVARVERDNAADVVNRAEARASAEAALAYLSAMYNLGGEEWPRLMGRVLLLPLAEPVAFRVVPEDAFVSLNGSSRETLMAFFTALTPSVQNPEHVVEQIFARREPPVSEAPQAGQEPRPWFSANELLLLDGVNPAALQGALGLLTVDSFNDAVNEQFAPAVLLRALYPDRADDILAARAALPNDPEAASDPSATTMFFRVQVQLGRPPLERRIEAVVAFEGIESGYQIVRWNEYNASFTFDE